MEKYKVIKEFKAPIHEDDRIRTFHLGEVIECVKDSIRTEILLLNGFIKEIKSEIEIYEGFTTKRDDVGVKHFHLTEINSLVEFDLPTVIIRNYNDSEKELINELLTKLKS